MKSFAKLMIFFTLSFAALFLAAIGVQFVFFRVELARMLSAELLPAENFAERAWAAIPEALYLAILLSLAFSAAQKIRVLPTVLCAALLGAAFVWGASAGMSRLETFMPAIRPASSIKAESGLILSRSENSVILLTGRAGHTDPRLVSIPGQPLIYQASPSGPNNTQASLPALNFEDDAPWFIRSIGLDFSLSAGELRTRYRENYIFFASYAFALILLLSSLRFLFELSRWPLANIFLGILIFRFILALEIFLNSREINALASSFLAGRVPPALITPLAFSGLGILVIVYTLLTGIIRRGRKADG